MLSPCLACGVSFDQEIDAPLGAGTREGERNAAPTDRDRCNGCVACRAVAGSRRGQRGARREAIRRRLHAVHGDAGVETGREARQGGRPRHHHRMGDIPLLRRDERRADLRLGRFRFARRARHHHDLFQDQGNGERGEGRARPERVAADAGGARSRDQVAEGFHRQAPHRAAGREGLEPGDHPADGGREGIRRREICRARSPDRVDVASGRDRRDARRTERDHGELLVGAVPVPPAEEPGDQAAAQLEGSVPRRSDVVQRRRRHLEVQATTIRSCSRLSSPA